jgi:proteasome lid subunit RPN8/RPN11
MNLDSTGIVISPGDWALMEADVSAKSPEEACGLVGGEANRARVIIPITNILHDSYRFRMDPEEELNAFMAIEQIGRAHV